ncbi:nucleotide exchange factor GrpE [Candidatus Microgenomates bacterium]|nr:nucleotide exchange factor GrpE [Candidatus Microgenomates bacterium]
MAKKKAVNPENENLPAGQAGLKLQLARALADYDNLAKRAEADRANITIVAQARVILRILPIFDMLINAQDHLKDQGLELVIQEFRGAISDLNVVEIKTEVGDEFNPELHEAIEVRDGNNGKIIEVTRSGYALDNKQSLSLRDKVLRHAQVIVGRSNDNHPERT